MKLLRSLALSCSLAPLFLTAASAAPLTLREESATQTLSVFRAGQAKPILTQNAGADFRPYIHPLVAPDGKGVLTQFSPDHHPHQTGLYWGLTRLNGRDYFHNPGAGYWRRVSSEALIPSGEEVKWRTVYQLLGEDGKPVMIETQLWSMRDFGDRYLLDLEWTGQAVTDLTIGEYAYGGLFLRMPWEKTLAASVINSNRERDQRADGKRAVWLDVGVKIPGRDDLAHVAIFDHPLNNGYPLPWRVDDQFGVGPTRATQAEWKIAREKSATYRHQFVVYTGEFSAPAITEAWKTYTGESNDNVLWTLARDEAKKAALLSGEQAAAAMTLRSGLEAKLYASEPAIAQPIAFCWDDRGRLWVAENRDYESRKTGFSGSGDSRIVILEDTDGDGKFDKRTVFIEGIPFPSAIAVGFDGLWLGAAPNLLFIPDRDHDDHADAGKIEVRLTGWGIQDRHEVLNSFTWGPDGWLYGCQGFATRSTVGKPADGGHIYRPGEPFPEKIAVKDAQFIDGGVWRYHPTKDRFEIVAQGFSNPWGLDFNDVGQMFVTACVIPHLWHVIPGGIYQRQGGNHINPYVYDDIKTIADHRHRSAHGGARVYLADEFPKEYRDRIFMANIHERALLTDILEPTGSGYVGHHGDETMLANDPMWVGFSLEIGPDGAVYILDWHDADICGASVLTKDTGRIFRIAPKGLPGKTGLNLAAQSDLELVELQQHRNDWYVRRSRLLLQQRAAESRLDARVAPRLWEIFAQATATPTKLRALWALHVTQNLPADRLLALLDHPEAYVRAWAVQLLCEDAPPDAPALTKFAALAQSDPSPVVRLYVASALTRLPLAARWPIAENLAAHAEDAADHDLPRLLWFAVEPLVPADPARALALAARSHIPAITRFIARRATAAKQLEPIVAAITTTSSLPARQALLEGLRDGLTSLGRRELTAPKNWSGVDTALTTADRTALRDLLTQVGQLFGDAGAASAQLATLTDASVPLARRREILLSFARDSYAPALPAVLALLTDSSLRHDAIRALASFDSAKVPAEILARYATWKTADKAEAIRTLVARKPSAEALFAALKNKTIPKRDVSAFAARQLQRVVGPAFVDFWGPLSTDTGDKIAEIAMLKRQLTDDALSRAHPSRGRATFERTCAVCHTLYGAGGQIGPDLTGSNRGNLDYILAQIVNPSEEIQEGYQLVTVTTRDGRTLAGNVAGEDDQRLTLRLIGQDTIVPKSEIMSREKSAVSMMPEGLLKMMPQDEVRDLIAYLRTTAQVPLATP
jgi:putative membrane-bound dehydrogenase-like protein